jgi:hypothetical protein
LAQNLSQVFFFLKRHFAEAIRLETTPQYLSAYKGRFEPFLINPLGRQILNLELEKIWQ